MDNNKRTDHYKRSEELEWVLKKLESQLSGIKSFESPKKFPVVFIMGCARSGTTLLTQLLSQIEEFCYPSNLISRFYYNPFIGSLIQKMLYDLDFNEELLAGFTRKQSFQSNLGKTTGFLSPHEFWYFWRRYFKFEGLQKLDVNALEKVDVATFYNELISIPNVFNKPLFLKGMILNWNIPFLYQNIPNCYFIYIKRETLYNAQSLLLSRLKFFGNYEDWYSFKPAEYEGLIQSSPEAQVVGQVKYTNHAIEEGLQEVPNNRMLAVDYEDLVYDPGRIMYQIMDMVGLSSTQRKFPKLDSSNKILLESGMWSELVRHASRI